MSNLLTAIEELSKLSEDEQDAVAAAILEELRSEQRRGKLVGGTTEEQRSRMTEAVRQDIEQRKVVSRNELLGDA